MTEYIEDKFEIEWQKESQNISPHTCQIDPQKLWQIKCENIWEVHEGTMSKNANGMSDSMRGLQALCLVSIPVVVNTIESGWGTLQGG